MRRDRALNHLALSACFELQTPLIIRAPGDDPLGPEAPCATTPFGPPTPLGPSTTAYIPGSSLRGALRAWARRRLARLGRPGLLGPETPDPLPRPPAERYRRAPLEARLFGAPGLRGRLQIFDLLPWPPDTPPETCAPAPTTHWTDGAGRRHAALAPGARLYTTLTLANFETWQLGLLADGLAALDRGALRLGGATARGHGRVTLDLLSLRYTQPAPSAELPLSLGELTDPDTAAAHGLHPGGLLPAKFGALSGLVRRFDVPVEQIPEWLAAGRAALEALA